MSGNLDLWNYFATREEELVGQIQVLNSELEALRGARAAAEQNSISTKERAQKLTIKDMVRSVLATHQEGGTSDQIAAWINQYHRAGVARTSLSPQLSRLKSDDELLLDEDLGIWYLAEFRDRYRFEQRRRVEKDPRVYSLASKHERSGRYDF